MIFFSPPLTWFTRILCAVVAICFAITIFVCLFYLFTLRRVVFPKWNWLKIVSVPMTKPNLIHSKMIIEANVNLHSKQQKQETLYTNAAAVCYLVASLLQLIFSNREDYKISLTYWDYYHDYLVAGVSIDLFRNNHPPPPRQRY